MTRRSELAAFVAARRRTIALDDEPVTPADLRAIEAGRKAFARGDSVSLGQLPRAHFTIPLRTVSVANRREHWAKKAARTKAERIATGWLMKQTGTRPLQPNETATVELCRIAPRMLDLDNLTIAMKAVRDGIAEGLGLPDDRDGHRVQWLYRQATGRVREYGVEVTITVARNL